MSTVLYGIPNCDTVRKARVWLDSNAITYQFHDYKKLGADAEQIGRWIAAAGLERVLNKAGTAYRKLPDAVKAGMQRETAKKLMAIHPSTIKRPIVEHDGRLLVGFKPDEWEAELTA